MTKDNDNKQPTKLEINRNKDHSFINSSHVSGGITDEEFADEFLAYPADPGTNEAKYQFNFLGADLERINSAQQTKDGLKGRQP